MALTAGTMDDVADSLAGAIEEAFAEVWQEEKEDGPPAVGQRDRRLMFVAIARGLLTYLDAHEADFTVTVADGSTTNVEINVA